MKLKLLCFSLLMLAMGASLPAQLTPAGSSTGSITTNAANCNTTNACIILHLASSNVGYSVTASGTWTGTLTVEQSGDNQGSWTSATTTTANTLFTSPLTPGITDVRVRGSAAMTGAAVITITASGPATLQQITQTSSSSSSSGPNSTTVYAWDPKYGLKADTKYVSDATFVNTSNVVTTPGTDRPFTLADVGKIMWGSNALVGGNAQTSITTLIAQGTITGFTNAHSVTVSNNALGSCTPTNSDGCTFVWGHDDTAALQAAFLDSSNNCGTLILPAGGMIVQDTVINLSTACQGGVASNDSPTGITVYGLGPYETMLYFSPSYTFTGPMFATQNIAARVYYHDFGVASFTSPGVASAGKNGFSIFFNSDISHVWFTDFFPSAANNFVALNVQGALNAVTSVHENLMVNSGFRSVIVSGQDVNIYDNWIQGATKCLDIFSASRIKTWGNKVTLCGTNGAASITSGQVDWSSSEDVFNAVGTTLPVVNIGGTAGTSVRFHNTIISGSQTSGPSLSISASNAVVIDGEFSSVTTSAGTANAITNAGTLTLRDTTLSSVGGVGLSNSGTVTVKEGNVFGNSITNTGVLQGQGVYEGSCTGVITSATTVGLYGLGQTTATACTSTTVGSGIVASKAGTIYALYCTATAGNQAADACTAVKNGTPQSMTCSLNAVASCSDGTAAHVVNYVAGDILGIEGIGGTATTLANIKGLIVAQ